MLVGAIDSTAWIAPATEPAAEEAEQTRTVPIFTQPKHFEYANQQCPKCGGTIGFDGYCEQCGAKAPNSRDHYAQAPSSWVAGATDRGIRHHRNEDALALDADEEPGSLAICLVCDGVSTATDSDVASMAAANAATQVLRQHCDDWAALATINRPMFDIADIDDDELHDLAEVVLTAIWTANQAVLANTVDAEGNPPSCTLVAGLVRDDHMLVASIGDSRAYWVPDRGEALQLSVDDSVAQEQMTLGMSREQAESGPHGHVITRWLGHDAPELRPHLTILPPQESAGYLVVCSDGLWNYASEPATLASLVSDAVQANDGDLPAACADLIDWANDQGGHDNITVSLARVAAKHSHAAADQETDEDHYDVATTRLRPAR